MVVNRKAYPTDASNEEWEFVAPYLTLIREDAAQRVHPLRELFDALRWMVKAGCFEAMVHDLREMVRLLNERHPRPTAMALDGRTMQSSPESGGRRLQAQKRQQGAPGDGQGRGICLRCW